VNDFAFVAIFIAFFVLAALFVAACDRILGSDEEALSTQPDVQGEPEPEQVAA
jgi:hypothetical protein